MRVVETFGPTIQGEGPFAGRACHFLRFGGCDFRCSWCDTPHAVLPALVRQAENLTPEEIAARLDALNPAPMLVISGGNPALQPLDNLLPLLQGYEIIAVETQGTRWRSWLNDIDSLVISPKPPSSGEASPQNFDRLHRFMGHAVQHPGAVLKIVVFDEEDLSWAAEVHAIWRSLPFYLSAGTDQDAPEEDLLGLVSGRYAWLAERVAEEPILHRAVVLPQLHVIAWGSRVGV